jgi:3'(2'), 5'-bisphosphate nucleotidase
MKRENDYMRSMMEKGSNRPAMLETFERAALEAGKAIMDVYRAGCTAASKADNSPVTIADEQAERIILAHLYRDFPDIPVIAEESVAAGIVPAVGSSFFLVDPLDGTREFVDKRPEFTVNIAFIVDGHPAAGIVFAPALGVAFLGENGTAEKLHVGPDFRVEKRLPINVRLAKAERTALASRSHNSPQTARFLAEQAISECKNIGSSLKFCLLAEGEADVYPRFTRTMEWDTAAGDAILRAAGGCTVTLDGRPLTYGKTRQAHDADFANPDFISWGNAPRL